MNNRNIPMPEISPDFTIEDIHKIREWNYERRKGMTPEEICEDTWKGAAPVIARINELKAAKARNAVPI